MPTDRFGPDAIATGSHLRMIASEFDTIAFRENSGYLTEAASIIEICADRIDQLEQMLAAHHTVGVLDDMNVGDICPVCKDRKEQP